MATYTKLNSGNWGVRGEGSAPNAGDTVTVTKKNGTTKVETVVRVLWKGADRRTGKPSWLAAVASEYRGSGKRDTSRDTSRLSRPAEPDNADDYMYPEANVGFF